MIEQPPEGTEPGLSAYLVRTMKPLENKTFLAPEAIIPVKPQNGKIYYFDKIIDPDITTAGFWGYHEGWVHL